MNQLLYNNDLQCATRQPSLWIALLTFAHQRCRNSNGNNDSVPIGPDFQLPSLHLPCCWKLQQHLQLPCAHQALGLRLSRLRDALEAIPVCIVSQNCATFETHLMRQGNCRLWVLQCVAALPHCDDWQLTTAKGKVAWWSQVLGSATYYCRLPLLPVQACRGSWTSAQSQPAKTKVWKNGTSNYNQMPPKGQATSGFCYPRSWNLQLL